MSRGPSCKNDPLFKLTANLHCPGDVWVQKHEDHPIRAEAKSRTGLVSAALGELMHSMGWDDPRMLVGLLADFVNRFPDDMRAAIAAAIIQGLGVAVKRDGENLEVDMKQHYNALAGDSGERRTPGGLILPGG